MDRSPVVDIVRGMAMIEGIEVDLTTTIASKFTDAEAMPSYAQIKPTCLDYEIADLPTELLIWDRDQYHELLVRLSYVKPIRDQKK